MTGLRRLVMDHRMLSAWLVACALLMKLLVPAGFMPVVANGAMTIEICTGSAPMQMAMPGMAHHQEKPDHPGRDMPCAFSGLSLASVPAADPLLLAVAIAIIMRFGVRVATTIAPGAPAHLRPPLRGPPLPI